MGNATESMVYAFGSKMTTRIKIGTSIDVNVRLGQIQGMCPFPLSVLWTTPGDHRLEDALHKRFEPLRVHGEWFDFAGVEDPVGEIAAAAEEESARLVKADEAWFPSNRPGWRPEVSIVRIRGAVMVMPLPGEGGWRCVALNERNGRQCTRLMDDRALFYLPSGWTYWVVPGLGTVEGRDFDFDDDRGSKRSPAELARMRHAALSQVCRKHLDSKDRLPVAWRPFDVERDIRSVTPWADSPGVAGVMPGLELLDEEVQDFVLGGLSEPLQLVFSNEEIEVAGEGALTDSPVPTLPPTSLREQVQQDMFEAYRRAITGGTAVALGG
jgi:hypothetical protein